MICQTFKIGTFIKFSLTHMSLSVKISLQFQSLQAEIVKIEMVQFGIY